MNPPPLLLQCLKLWKLRFETIQILKVFGLIHFTLPAVVVVVVVVVVEVKVVDVSGCT